jgi:hypothetical protein
VDACCSPDGANSLCNTYCTPGERDFFAADLTGQHVWINAPFNMLRQFVARYKQQKRLSPHNTSACILVPCRGRDAKMHTMLSNMKVLMELPANTALFTSVGPGSARTPLPPCKFRVRVYYDPPCAAHTFVNVVTQGVSGKPSMMFSGSVAAHPSPILMDSGAGDNFIDADLVKHLGLTVSPFHGSLETATGQVGAILGTCTAPIRIQQYRGKVSLLVCKLSSAFDVVLGDTWLVQHNACLDYADKSCVLRKGTTRITLRIKTASSCKPAPASTLLSALQFKKSVKHGNAAFLVVVSPADMTDAAQQPDGTVSC